MTKTLSDKSIEITSEDLEKLINKINREGRDKGLTTTQLKEKKNWAKNMVIIWGTRIGLIGFALTIFISLGILTKYVYLISQDEKTFCNAMELWGVVILVSLITNCTSAFFNNLFSKVIK